MAIKQMLRRSLSSERRSELAEVRKGHVAVYIGECDEKKRFVIPVSYLNHSFCFKLRKNSGSITPMGGLTIPCSQDLFIDVVSGLSTT